MVWILVLKGEADRVFNILQLCNTEKGFLEKDKCSPLAMDVDTQALLQGVFVASFISPMGHELMQNCRCKNRKTLSRSDAKSEAKCAGVESSESQTPADIKVSLRNALIGESPGSTLNQWHSWQEILRRAAPDTVATNIAKSFV